MRNSIIAAITLFSVNNVELPHRPRDFSVAVVVCIDDEAQQIAQSRANYMAKHGYRGHPPRSEADWQSIEQATFEGVGWRYRVVRREMIPTCRPSGVSSASDDDSRELLADAAASSEYGSFRVRIWGK